MLLRKEKWKLFSPSRRWHSLQQSIPRVSIPSGICRAFLIFVWKSRKCPTVGRAVQTKTPGWFKKECANASPLLPSSIFWLLIHVSRSQNQTFRSSVFAPKPWTRKRLLHMLPCLRHWISQGPSFLPVKCKWRFPNLSHLRQTGTVVQPAFAAYNRAVARFLWEMRQVLKTQKRAIPSPTRARNSAYQ